MILCFSDWQVIILENSNKLGGFGKNFSGISRSTSDVKRQGGTATFPLCTNCAPDRSKQWRTACKTSNLTKPNYQTRTSNGKQERKLGRATIIYGIQEANIWHSGGRRSVPTRTEFDPVQLHQRESRGCESRSWACNLPCEALILTHSGPCKP